MSQATDNKVFCDERNHDIPLVNQRFLDSRIDHQEN